MGNGGATVSGSSSLNGLGCPFGVRSAAAFGTIGLGVSVGFTNSGSVGTGDVGIIGEAIFISGTELACEAGSTTGVTGITGFGSVGPATGDGIFKSSIEGGGAGAPVIASTGTETGAAGTGTGVLRITGSAYVAWRTCCWGHT